jgi:hypothetical protein
MEKCQKCHITSVWLQTKTMQKHVLLVEPFLEIFGFWKFLKFALEFFTLKVLKLLASCFFGKKMAIH